MARDIGRARLYAAEDQIARMLDRASGRSAGGGSTVEFHGSRLTLPVERRFADVASVQRFVDAVLSLASVRARWGVLPPVTVRERAGQRAAHYEPPGGIAVPARERWALRELVVCHEIAHHVADHTAQRAGGGDRARHGPPFPDCYAALVGHVIGPEVELLLRGAFHQSGVISTNTSASPRTAVGRAS